MTDHLRNILTDLQFVEALVDDVISKVNRQHTADGPARVKVYEDIGEKFTGLARALGGQTDHGIVEQ